MIRPFAKPEQEFMMMHNSVIDAIMPLCSGAEFKILMAIFRKTRGWDKDADRISYSQLMDMTGIRSSATISGATSSLEEKGMILMISGDTKTSNAYALNYDYAINVEKTKDDLLQKLKNTSLQNKDTKDTIKDKENIKELTPTGVDPEYVDVGNEFEEKPKPSKKKQADDMFMAIVRVTESDYRIKTVAGHINKVGLELREAGYTPEDVEAFGREWKNDWRYKKDGKPPRIAVVHSEIKKAERKQSTEDWLAERRRKTRESLIAQGIDINDYDYLRKD